MRRTVHLGGMMGAIVALLTGSAFADASLDAAWLGAAREANRDRVMELLAKGVNVNAVTPTGETALHFAAQADDLVAAQALVKAGATVNANKYGVSPLIPACTRGNAAMIELLLTAGADVNQPMPDGRTPLMVAAQTGKVDAVQTLLSHGAQPDAREPAQRQTALMWAAAEGNRDAMLALLRGGAELGMKSKGGFSAFLFAVRQGHREVVRAFLEAGANANESVGERGGASALSLAVTNAHYELGALLLEAGANPNYTWQGRTVLHLLTWVRRPGAGSNDPAPEGSGNVSDLEFVRLLVQRGADVNRRMTSSRGGPRTTLNLNGATPFLLAARTADAELMRLLAELGADPLVPNADETTPLMVAAGVGVQSPGEDPGTESEVLAAVKVAVELGNDVNAVDKRGNTAMHGAAFKWAASVVPYLMEKGAKIEIWNQKNRQGWTPLRIAAGVHRGMNLRSSPQTADALRAVMTAAGVSTEVEPETNVNGGTK